MISFLFLKLKKRMFVFAWRMVGREVPLGPGWGCASGVSRFFTYILFGFVF